MHKLYFITLLCAIILSVKAQTASPTTQPFGKIDIADLELKDCDFEKGANAEVLFNKSNVYFNANYDIVNEIHKRVKIFNDNGKGYANIRITYYGSDRSEYLSGLQAETINLVNGSPEIVKVDKKQIFNETIDRSQSATVFSFPNVKPGSVIEYKYSVVSKNIGNFPDWYFQTSIPTRYSELTTNTPDVLYYKNLESIHQPYAVNKENRDGSVTKALANVPSIPDEPFMSSLEDNCQRILFQLMTIRPFGGRIISFSDTWQKVGETLMESTSFGLQLNHKIAGEEALIAKAKSMANTDDKIAYIFNEVKSAMKWTGVYSKYCDDGISKAWDKKIGNSGEINMIVYHLLKKSGISVYPMITSTRKNGRVNPAYPNYYQFNSTAAYVPVDSTRFYVLDASNKYNIYNQIPANLLNSFGFYMDKDKKEYSTVFLQNTQPVRQVVMIDGAIAATGKMTGAAQVSNFGYNRVNEAGRYKTDGEKKFIDYLINNDNNLKISSLNFEGMETDTLPLTHKVAFELELTGSDDNYIYFNPNMLSGVKTNPFLSESRFTDIDFGYRSNYAIICNFKMPAGYKVDALPASINLTMPDKSIVFRRMTAEQNGVIVVRFVIDQKQSIYFKENYEDFHAFFKKMYEMLNEQIVLKKA
ncbi:DUF3857 domain-containing protein [Mucilaginibacter phyllosphaerae]|uniref:DUF3857 domain-containing protein n=1 Tax=Mucilaginibacter phyllosphaerae TaxID=1812349 RepID=A0A4Y8AF42_9SPHI|nr:DUF3857 domain-containing protein [Mucilaginibacter phyllosphaerae]MBB3970386.1 hypothetical protein [Mucilaginibacter phyllosphaerae]TEW66752.1 DUF3857 domain-containing protein [Mucilaginibacter phyllosphaerae]GGH11690.1 hypothetical protein GCM10007352_18070 [Mucilaginibacter phyllosphaerae]